MNTGETGSTKNWLLRKRNIASLFFLLGLGVAVLAFYTKDTLTDKQANASNDALSYDWANTVESKRLKSYKNVQPYISVEPKFESPNLRPLKEELVELVDDIKSKGAATQVSIYFTNDQSEWISINGDEKYHPASLMKVPLMLAWLKMAEANPGLLTESMVYKPEPGLMLEEQHFKDKSLEIGKTYTLHDLLFYMIAYSDNHATQVLSKRIDAKWVANIFQELGLPQPTPAQQNYSLSAPEFSMFIKSIYNSVFLSPEYSEYGAEIMANCSFKEGFKKGFPAGTKMWHKFGERTAEGNTELHESGIIFIAEKPYLLTVMTKGSEHGQLANVIQQVSEKIYRAYLP